MLETRFRSPRRGSSKRRDSSLEHRRLAVEPLEDRTLLSVLAGSAKDSVAPAVAHPTYVLFEPNGVPADFAAPPAGAFTPAEIKQAYGINLVTDGGVLQDGTGETIAIIDAYDNPDFVSRNGNSDVTQDTNFLASDLHQFDVQFGLPEPANFFTKVNQTGGTVAPPLDPQRGWETETALDVEWVHAIAPGAKIILIEANSASDADLAAAEAWARDYSGLGCLDELWRPRQPDRNQRGLHLS